MAAIQFTVSHSFDAPASVVWAEMIDWPNHADWIPATRMEVHSGDGQTVGAEFTGYTGCGPLTLVDHMRVTAHSWDETGPSGYCEVEKLGPVLKGRAGFDVISEDTGSRVDWFEDVTVPYLPGFLAPLVSKLSAAGFAFGMKRLAKVIEAKRAGHGEDQQPAQVTAGR